MSGPVVTQADRDFASRWASFPHDHTPLAKDAARHRHQSTASHIAAMEAAAEALDESNRQLAYIDERSPSGTSPAVMARNTAALTDLRTHIENAKGGEEE